MKRAEPKASFKIGERGAVAADGCPTRYCQCAGPCVVCGFAPHYALHMHAARASIDDPPYGHAYILPQVET